MSDFWTNPPLHESICREVAMDPSSGKAWFEFVGMMILTYGPLSDFLRLRKLVAQGVMFESHE